MNAFTPPPPSPPARERAINAPPAVVWLIGAMALVHLVRVLAGPQIDLEILYRFAFVPARFTGIGALAAVPDLADALSSLAGHMFLHGDVAHLGINALWLLAFGAPVARRMGGIAFVVFFLLCGFGGAALHTAANFGSPVPMVGASGAISGVMAAALRLVFGRDGVDSIAWGAPAPLFGPRFLMVTAIWLATNAIVGLYGGALVGEGQAIAWEAHVGGYLTGALLLGLFPRQSPLARL